ncbi:DUF3300 domain-containing protein [Hyphomicrobium sp.]|uniref:DUF3300 domain-containing protein n=1 Tax=Hyphomicrobium sp. TaxID=82 RepID=UPI001DA7A61A|nr:DUF3300 domain-containing protein [Hyphomicrobium sp.]MBY0561858.1 DUF3300 domain-containing protein [Hyphomicrobium sp.]
MKTVLMSWLVLIALAISGQAPLRAEDQKFSKQQLDQMLAPIALYPDDLLSNVLMASTYPLDVVEAERWRSAQENVNLQGNALVDALKSKDWDPSIKALVQFPDVLKMMSDQLDWTQKLGDAFLAQQDDIMNEIQLLRSKAEGSGHLKSNSQQTVTRDDGAYVIQPANPDTVYVPVYEPSVVYGPWWYPDYPPYYWGYPGAVFTDGYFWGAGAIAIAGGIWGWNHWDWRHRHINVDGNRWNAINGGHHRFTNNVWKHNPNHSGRIPRGDKNFNRSDIERRLQKTDRPALNNKTPNRGAQLRNDGQRVSKVRDGGGKSIKSRGGSGGRNFVKQRQPQSFRGGQRVSRQAFHANRGGARRGGGRRR